MHRLTTAFGVGCRSIRVRPTASLTVLHYQGPGITFSSLAPMSVRAA